MFYINKIYRNTMYEVWNSNTISDQLSNYAHAFETLINQYSVNTLNALDLIE